MARRLSYISIFSLYIVQHINAQTGAGCFSQTCSNPGLVRMDAVIENGQFVGGCNCACHPGLYDRNSHRYCPEPNVVNFDSRTLEGDCTCQCDPMASIDPTSCVYPTTYNPATCSCGCPAWAADPASCRAPTEFVPELCQCACPDLGSVGGPCVVRGNPVVGSMVRPDCTCDGGTVQCQGNQEVDPSTGECHCPEKSASGAWYPSCEYPLVKDPITCDCAVKTTTLPPVGPMSVQCADAGDCECPYGTKGDCTITCDGTNDACKDGIVNCNSDGFDCTVNCVAGSSCAGATVINGPVGAKLTVNCMGSQSCEGSVVINNHQGTDTTIVCDGGQSCKGSVEFNFGTGYSRVACNGDPDSCQGGALFNLPPGAESMAGAAFLCTGAFCPNYAPVPFSNAPPPTYPQMTNPQPAPAPLNPSPWSPQNPMNPVPSSPSPWNPSVPSPWTPYNPVNPNPPAPLPTFPQSNNPVPLQPRPAPAPGTGTIPDPLPGAGGNVIIAGTPPIPVVMAKEIVVCDGGQCVCSNTQACTLQCTSGDACKDSELLCPADFDCTLICADNTCDKAQVTGPVGHDLEVLCTGESACMNANFMAAESRDVAYTCSGKDACKGASTKINCGVGHCTVDCSGEATCDSSDIMPHSALSFDCYGRDAPCPRSYTAAPVPEPTLSPTDPCFGMGPCPCLNQQCFEERDPATCECQCPFEILLLAHRKDPAICGTGNPMHEYIDSACACDCPLGSEPMGGCPGGQIFNEEMCQCECPLAIECGGSSILNPVTCQCECPSWAPKASDCLALNKVLRDCECQCPIPCPGPGQIQSSSSCRCGCPFTTPDPASCASGFIDELYCQCAKPLKPPSTYCCLTAEAGFLPWAGRCWGQMDELSCSTVENNRCVWNPEQCLPDPPVNSIDPSKGCLFRDDPCTSGADCCSEVCRVNGLCR